MFTFQNHIIDLQVSLKNYFKKKKLQSNDDVLLEIKEKSFSELINEIKPFKSTWIFY